MYKSCLFLTGGSVERHPRSTTRIEARKRQRQQHHEHRGADGHPQMIERVSRSGQDQSDQQHRTGPARSHRRLASPDLNRQLGRAKVPE